jgi:predicted ATPase/class 3 adenylate cyclase
MGPVERGLPGGTVTFLFTDVEGSTQLLHELGPEGYAEALAQHRRLLRAAFTAQGGVEVDTQGDAFFVAFPSPSGALAAAEEALAGLAGTRIRIRVGIHSGTPHLTEDGYVGEDVHLGARIAAAGHGGQVVLSQATRALVEAEAVDLGEHRLKDFAEPVWIFQLGTERFPPLKTISNTNLPRPASSFVGRARELQEVVSLLREEVRLLTLSGPGGSGKTRLAIEAAAELVPEFKNGVFWAGLATLRDPALVVETVAQTIGAKDSLAEHIGERELLLLLDNLEQVVDAAPELAALVEACPNLKLLVTSRELLRVRGEVEYSVPPLAEPEAVELFCARAQLPPDATIAELCRRLDNLPLALELAAARTRALSPTQILKRLSQRLDLLKGGRDAEARQQTLRATIAWSYDLLTEEEKRLFARLAVFRGGCTLASAEQVVEADLDVLQSLVEKSILRHTEERFWMLETIREYALERLEESGEAEELRARHAEHFLALAEEAEPHLREYVKAWLDCLETEHDNLRATFEHVEAAGEIQLALQLAGALALFWDGRYPAEGRRRLERLLAADNDLTAARGRALNGAARLAFVGGDSAATTVYAQEALEINRACGESWHAAHSVLLLGTAECNPAQATKLLEESVRLFTVIGDEHFTLLSMFNLAYTCKELGDRERARALYEDVLRRARKLPNARTEALALGNLAGMASDEGRDDDALPLLKAALRIDRDLGDVRLAARELSRFAVVYAHEGRAASAARLLSISDALRQRIGAADDWYEFDETLASIRAELGEDAFAEEWAEGRTLTLDDAIKLALAEAE